MGGETEERFPLAPSPSRKKRGMVLGHTPSSGGHPRNAPERQIPREELFFRLRATPLMSSAHL